MVSPLCSTFSQCQLRESSDLPSIAEDTVLALIRERYVSSHPYTALSPNALISVNPFAYQPINGDQILQDYMAEHHDSSVEDTSLRSSDSDPAEKGGPHVFRMAYSAYYNMQRTRQDQVIVLRYVFPSSTGAPNTDSQWYYGLGQVRSQASGHQSHLRAVRPSTRQARFKDRSANRQRRGKSASQNPTLISVHLRIVWPCTHPHQ